MSSLRDNAQVPNLAEAATRHFHVEMDVSTSGVAVDCTPDPF